LQYGDKEKTLKGGDPSTTNNRMEMTAAIKAIEAINETYTGEIILWTDSTYVMKGITEWIHGWKKKNWIKSDKKPVINTDLWKVLDNLNSQKNIQWNWVKGHAGVEGNERADELARQGLEEIRS
jgi:ribonuclease HI